MITPDWEETGDFDWQIATAALRKTYGSTFLIDVFSGIQFNDTKKNCVYVWCFISCFECLRDPYSMWSLNIDRLIKDHCCILARRFWT